MKKYLKLKDENAFLKVELSYSKGGMNYLSSKEEARGYYFSMSPVVRVKKEMDGKDYYTETYSAFKGVKKFILETKRCSKVDFSKALQVAASLEPEFIKYMADRGYKLQKS